MTDTNEIAAARERLGKVARLDEDRPFFAGLRALLAEHDAARNEIMERLVCPNCGGCTPPEYAVTFRGWAYCPKCAEGFLNSLWAEHDASRGVGCNERAVRIVVEPESAS